VTSILTDKDDNDGCFLDIHDYPVLVHSGKTS